MADIRRDVLRLQAAVTYFRGERDRLQAMLLEEKGDEALIIRRARGLCDRIGNESNRVNLIQATGRAMNELDVILSLCWGDESLQQSPTASKYKQMEELLLSAPSPTDYDSLVYHQWYARSREVLLPDGRVAGAKDDADDTLVP